MDPRGFHEERVLEDRELQCFFIALIVEDEDRLLEVECLDEVNGTHVDHGVDSVDTLAREDDDSSQE